MATTNYSRIYTRISKQYVWWIERDSIGIALYDPLTSEKNRFKSPDAVYEITLFYYKKPTALKTLDVAGADLTDDPDIPTQFHQYLVDRAIQLGYEQDADPRMAQYFEMKFEKGVKEGKTFANRGRVSGSFQIKQHDM
tara:strand:+ start:267 stop:680 length:414 start_codon:yes stop_codon:yes gene_type:complete